MFSLGDVVHDEYGTGPVVYASRRTIVVRYPAGPTSEAWDRSVIVGTPGYRRLTIVREEAS